MRHGFLVSVVTVVVLAGCTSRKPEQKPAAAAPTATPGSAASTRVTKPAPAAPGVEPKFIDVAASSGIAFTYFNDPVPDRFFVPEVMGGGAAWLDYDLDGRLDLHLTNGSRINDDGTGDGEHRDQFFRAVGGGRFVNVTPACGAGEDRFGQGVAVGDYDADGFPDLFLANYGPDTLLHNNGDGTFTEVSAAGGVGGDEEWGTSAAFADLDGDGILDLYVCNFLDVTLATSEPCTWAGGPGYCGPGSYLGVQDRVYYGRGDGTFAERAVATGFEEFEGRGKGLCLVIVDLDDDLVPEVYVGNDMMPNYLYVWEPPASASSGGIGRYVERGLNAGCAVSDEGANEATMGIACDDFNEDGRPDIFLLHFHKAKNTLYHNLGGLTFSDESRRTRIAATSFDNLGFGTVALDWDRDGRLEMFNATGNVLGPNTQPCEMPPQLLWRSGRETFADVSQRVAGDYFAGKWLGRGVAGADYDDDGDLDIAVCHNTSPFVLLRNDTEAPGRFLSLDLATPSRIPPVGGRVEVESGGIRMVRPIASGGTYLSSHDPRLLFTLASDGAPAKVTIHWPNGQIDRFELEGDAFWRVVQGGPPSRLEPKR